MTQSTDCHSMSRTLAALLMFTLSCAFAGIAWAGSQNATTSPGIQIGVTAYDAQQRNAVGRQIAKNPGANTVHFCWTMWDHIPASIEDTDRFVQYSSYDIASAQLNQGMNGTSVSLGEWARAGLCRIDTDSDNLAHMVFHQRETAEHPYKTWQLHFPLEGSDLHLDTLLRSPTLFPDEVEIMWPDVAVEQNHGTKDASTDIWHVIALGIPDVGGGYVITNNRLWYWRYDAGAATPVWEGPVIIDSTRDLSYTIEADDNSDRVCLIFTSDYDTDGLNGLNNVAYRETQTSGIGWLSGPELGELNKNFVTSYHVPGGPQAWTETSVLYDHSGDLHILYTEQREEGSDHIALKHWRMLRGTSTVVAYAWYDHPGFWERSFGISQISLGVGDGSTLCDGGGEDNTDYLYAVYSTLDGIELPPEEEWMDTSATGLCNAELYLSVSRDHGNFWSNPINLTNTKTPDCSPVDPEVPGPGDCASEAWASLARHVDDLHILYIADRQAGAYDESGWTINPVMYLRIPGGSTDDPYLCATLPPVYAGSLDSNAGSCGYYEVLVGEQDSTTLRIYNTGPGPMTGTMSVRYPELTNWLLIDGVAAVDYTVPPADSMTAVITLTSGGREPGRYGGQVLVSHNDHLQADPDTFVIVLEVDWCIHRADPQPDGVTNVLDVVQTVNVAFRGAPPVFDINCEWARTDVDCNGLTDVLDVVHIVNVAFRSADPSEEFRCDCY